MDEKSKKCLSDLLKFNIDLAKEFLIKTNGSIPIPMMAYAVITQNDGKNMISPIEIENSEERFEILSYLGGNFARKKNLGEISSVEAVCFMAEAWMSKIDTSKMSKKEKEDVQRKSLSGEIKRPSEDPNRVECLTVVAKSRDGQKFSHMYEIFKSWDGEKIKVELKDMAAELTDKEGIKIESPLLDSFWRGYAIINDNWEGFCDYQKNNTK